MVLKQVKNYEHLDWNHQQQQQSAFPSGMEMVSDGGLCTCIWQWVLTLLIAAVTAAFSAAELPPPSDIHVFLQLIPPITSL